jgi:hypothetical protein
MTRRGGPGAALRLLGLSLAGSCLMGTELAAVAAACATGTGLTLSCLMGILLATTSSMLAMGLPASACMLGAGLAVLFDREDAGFFYFFLLDCYLGGGAWEKGLAEQAVHIAVLGR